MKVRWKEHEIILVSMGAAILLAGYLWRIYHLSPGEIASAYATPFTEHRVPFNLYRNVVIPDLATGLLIYLAYLFINLFTIPRFLGKRGKNQATGASSLGLTWFQNFFQKSPGQYALLIIQIVCVISILCLSVVLSTYYQFRWKFIYPEFSLFPQVGYSPNEQIDISGSFQGVAVCCLAYLAYTFVRETIIYYMQAPGNRQAYIALICNRVTAFLVFYISIPFFVAVFHLTHDSHLIAFYFCFVIPIFLVFISNTYWLFPLKGKHDFLSRYLLYRLLISTFILSLPSLLTPFHQGSVFDFLTFWAVQLWLVTPVTWLLYQQRKDKILQLRGVEKDLVQSQADLQFLRAQINPHFLFNSLNTLYGTALQENSERTATGIQQLGDMMRFMLHENNQDLIEMAREIEYLKNYLSLQKLRIAPSADIIIEDHIQEQHCHHKIAPMLLIPWVENAFKHGLHLDKRSWIKINLHCTGSEIVFEVRNSIHPVQDNDTEKEKGGIGNNNVLERLRLIYPGKHHISITGVDEEFYVKLVILP